MHSAITDIFVDSHRALANQPMYNDFCMTRDIKGLLDREF